MSIPPPDRPEAVVIFERLFMLSIGIGFVQAVLGWEQLLERAPASTILMTLAMTLGTQATLVLLVSRARHAAARWVLLGMLIIGVPLYLSSMNQGTLIGSGMLSLLQALLQSVSVGFLFTPSAGDWLRRR